MLFDPRLDAREPVVALGEDEGQPHDRRPAKTQSLPIAIGREVFVQLTLSRLNSQWPAWEGHPESMEGVTARPLCGQRCLKGWNEVLHLVHSHPGERQERGRAGLQARARATGPRGGLLASEASYTINRDKLNWTPVGAWE